MYDILAPDVVWGGVAKFKTREESAQDPGKISWSFRPDEDVALAVERALKDHSDRWPTKSELINQALREAVAVEAADAIESIIIQEKLAELQAQVSALRQLAEARAGVGKPGGAAAFDAARDALRKLTVKKKAEPR